MNISPPVIQIDATEPFGIPESNWNDVVEYLYKTRPLGVNPAESNIRFNHPWKTLVQFDFEQQAWTAKVQPGFVRGHEVELSTVEQFCESYTFKRLGFNSDHEPEKDKEIVARLTEHPRVRLHDDLWHVAVGSETLQLEVDGERNRPIPEILFKLYNVKVDKVVRVDTETNTIEQDLSEELNQNPQTARQLRSLEIVLHQPRPTIEPVFIDDPVLGREVIELHVRYALADDELPALRLYRTLPIELQPGSGGEFNALSALLEAQKGYQPLHIATVWMLGPPGDFESENPNQEWLPLVQHHVHWNLDYTVNAEVNRIPPLRLNNPAAFLAGGSSAQFLVDDINEQNAQVESLMQTVQIDGEFWTV